MMRPIGDFIVLEQKMVKKKSAIILTDKTPDESKFDFSFKIIRIGEDCKRKIAIGEIPILAKYRTIHAIDVLEKDDNGMLCHIMVHENDIVGVDEPDEIKKDTETSSN